MFPTAAISGQATNETYSQTLTVGNFYIILLLQGLSSEEEMELGHNLLSKIEQTINQTPTVNPTDIVQMEGEQFKDQVTLSLLVGKIEGQKLWISGIGKVQGKLVRKGKLVQLLAEGSEVKNVSGPLLHDDFLLFGTTALVSMLPAEELVNFPQVALEETREKISPAIEAKENGSEMAVLFVRVDLIENARESVPVESPAVVLPPPPAVDSPNISVDEPRASLLEKFKPKGLWLPKAISPENPSSRKTLYLAAVIFLIFASLISFQLRSKNLETNAQNLAVVEKQTNEGLTAAAKLAGLNDEIARETLVQTKKDTLVHIESLYGADWQTKNIPDKKKLLEILGKIDAQMEKVSHVYSVSELPTFYDFSLMKSGPKIVSANLHDGKIVALDGANGAIYSVATANKGAELVTGGSDLKTAKLIDSTLDSVYVFSSKGILGKKLTESDALKQVAPLSSQFGEIRGIAAFGGNLYLLDPKNNQIWKVQGTESGFDTPVNYIKEGLSLSIARGIAMNIDGFIYVLTSSGQILKLAGGDVSEFTFSGLPDEVSSPTAFFTSDQVENIYIWDEGSKAVFVVDKKGMYQAQYKLGSLSKGLGANPKILADEQVKKIFLVSDSMVFWIGIK